MFLVAAVVVAVVVAQWWWEKNKKKISAFFVEKGLEEGYQQQISNLFKFLFVDKKELGLNYTLFELDVKDFKEILDMERTSQEDLEKVIQGKNKVVFRFKDSSLDLSFKIKIGEKGSEGKTFFTKPLYKSKENVLDFFNFLFIKTMEQQKKKYRLNLKFEKGGLILEILKKMGK